MAKELRKSLPEVFRCFQVFPGAQKTSKKNETAANAYGDGFGAASRADFSENRRDVEFGGVLGDGQPRGDFLIRQSAREYLQHLAFAWRKRLGSQGSLGRLERRLPRIHHAGRHPAHLQHCHWTESRTALLHFH